MTNKDTIEDALKSSIKFNAEQFANGVTFIACIEKWPHSTTIGDLVLMKLELLSALTLTAHDITNKTLFKLRSRQSVADGWIDVAMRLDDGSLWKRETPDEQPHPIPDGWVYGNDTNTVLINPDGERWALQQ